jgi:hypothetical protein
MCNYDKLKASNRFAMMVYASTAVLTIWIPYIALSINVAVLDIVVLFIID